MSTASEMLMSLQKQQSLLKSEPPQKLRKHIMSGINKWFVRNDNNNFDCLIVKINEIDKMM